MKTQIFNNIIFISKIILLNQRVGTEIYRWKFVEYLVGLALLDLPYLLVEFLYTGLERLVLLTQFLVIKILHLFYMRYAFLNTVVITHCYILLFDIFCFCFCFRFGFLDTVLKFIHGRLQMFHLVECLLKSTPQHHREFHIIDA